MPFKYIFFHLEPLNEGGLLTCPESKATGEPLQDNGNYKISISITGFIDDSSYNISLMFIYNLHLQPQLVKKGVHNPLLTVPQIAGLL